MIEGSVSCVSINYYICCFQVMIDGQIFIGICSVGCGGIICQVGVIESVFYYFIVQVEIKVWKIKLIGLIVIVCFGFISGIRYRRIIVVKLNLLWFEYFIGFLFKEIYFIIKFY